MRHPETLGKATLPSEECDPPEWCGPLGLLISETLLSPGHDGSLLDAGGRVEEDAAVHKVAAPDAGKGGTLPVAIRPGVVLLRRASTRGSPRGKLLIWTVREPRFGCAVRRRPVVLLELLAREFHQTKGQRIFPRQAFCGNYPPRALATRHAPFDAVVQAFRQPASEVEFT